MLKQAKKRSYACLGTKLVGGVIASLIIFQVVGAMPIPNDLLRIHDDPIAIRKAWDAKDAPASLALAGQSSGASRKSGKLWTAQFFNQPDFPGGPPFGMIDHLGPPPAGPGPELAEGMPSKLVPRKACLEAINWQMGDYGYRKSKLLLSDDQKPAWKAVEGAVDAFTQNMRAVCGTLPSHYAGSPGIVERSDFLERQLSARLDFLRALKMPLERLLGQLTPDQRASFDAHLHFHRSRLVEPVGCRRSMSEQPAVPNSSGEGRISTEYLTLFPSISGPFCIMHWPSSLALAGRVDRCKIRYRNQTQSHG